MRIINLKASGRVLGFAGIGLFMPIREKGTLAGLPFRDVIDCRTRDSFAKFRGHLFAEMKRVNEQLIADLDALDERSVLACWCVDLEDEAIFWRPEACLCQVVWKAWRWRRREIAPAPADTAGDERPSTSMGEWASMPAYRL
jgi:hypothetical protein